MSNELFKKGFTILDGASGTMLQKLGMKPGESPIEMNLKGPELVLELNRSYFKAGSDIVSSNTFSASEFIGKGRDVKEAFFKAIAIAKQAAGEFGGRVAADIGPIGRLMEPMGDLSADEAYDILSKQCLWAEEAGADFIFFETMTDILECKIGVLAAKKLTKLPVMASMSFEASGRTFLGCSLGAMALTLQKAGACALGINCSVGPAEAIVMAKEIVKYTDLPIIIKPNAGLPRLEDGKTFYDVKPEDFASAMVGLTDMGVTIMGGCCGTSPEYIQALVEALKDKAPGARPTPNTTAICSASEIIESLEDAEADYSLNSLKSGDVCFDDEEELTDIALDCEDDIISICAAGCDGDETENLKKAITCIQSVTRKPLTIEASTPEIIAEIDRFYRGKL